MKARETSVQYIKGIGPRRAEIFARLGVNTAEDLLYYLPRDWEDRRSETLLSLMRMRDVSIIHGRVATVRFIQVKGMGILKVTVDDGAGHIYDCSWFKRSFRMAYDPFASLRKNMTEGRGIWVIGRAQDNSEYRLSVDEHHFDDDPLCHIHVNRITPVYPLSEGLTAPLVREATWRAVTEFSAHVDDCIPLPLRQKRGLLSVAQALKGIHYPASMAELDAARTRIAYEELLLLTTAWAIRKTQLAGGKKGYGYEIKRTLLTPLRGALGFEFTSAQKRVINEIFCDMRSSRAMTRLLQGDVGSGKTVVALCAMLLAVENGYQAAFVAPTEILAEQHFLTIRKFLGELPVRVALLTSGVKGKKRQALLDDAREGRVDILVGTHAILEEAVAFRNLRVAVVDEQHRFGVIQRGELRRKSSGLDMLIMTATPIPRTLALALYGDLDLSVLDELPPGRKPITTQELPEGQAFDRAREELAKGGQVYIVHPVIEESKTAELKSVKLEFERLGGIFPGVEMGMIHGSMKSAEKARAMEEFASGKTRILVATPVIEVGIDVRSASVMIIQNAEHFGLASLHQLRGRVGRGAAESFCFPVLAQDAGALARERVRAFCASQDGFRLGEKDMEMRGPGEIVGTRQSGDFEFIAADLVRDREALGWAVEDRDFILKGDPHLDDPDNWSFRMRLRELYGRKLGLIDIA